MINPCDKIEEQVLNIVKDEMFCDNVTPETTFADDLGADSIETDELATALETKFDISISEADATRWTTVNDTVECVKSKLFEKEGL